MNKLNFDKKYIKIMIIAIFLICILVVSIFLNKVIFKPEIINLNKFNYSKDGIRNEYYLIKNSPNNINNLKKLVDDFNMKNPIEKVTNGEYEVSRNFLRESNYTPEFGMKDLPIDEHLPVDCIAYIAFDTNNNNIIFASYMKKAKNGKLINEIKEDYTKKSDY